MRIFFTGRCLEAGGEGFRTAGSVGAVHSRAAAIRLLEENPGYHALDEETMDVIVALTRNNALKELTEKRRHNASSEADGKKEKEEYNMWEAMEELIEDGKKEGIAKGISEGIRALVETCYEFGISQEATASRLVDKFSITMEASEGYVRQYWG